ncbi:MAG: dephospho-CoA kinase [Aquiluna sp.]|nr:dephospho-CoA kinase [Aquiluna sp.]
MLIGLTGGIGSGKSTVAKRLVELGATEIDADLLAREVVAPGTEGLEAVAGRFGEDLVNADGSLDRALLAQRAFSSEENRKALEAILHPLIQRLSRERISQATGLVVYTIPLLVETDSTLPFDKIVTVSAPVDVRVERLVQSRGMTETEARARIAAQASDAQREAIADFVINADCTMEELFAQVDRIHAEVSN